MSQVGIGEVALAVRGVAFSSGDVSRSAGPGLIACLTTSAVQTELDWGSARYIPEDIATSDQILRPGDLLVSTANSSSLVGRAALVKEATFRATFGAFVTVLRPGPAVDPAYLNYWLRTDTFLREARSRASQTTSIANLRVSDLLSMELPLPTLQRQREIVARLYARLGSAHHAREASRARRRAIVELRASIRSRFFARLPGGRHRLGDILSERDSFADGPFGSNLKSDHYQPSGVRVIRLGNIGLGEFLDADRAYVSEEHFHQLVRHSVSSSDIVVAALGDGIRPAGRACVVPDHLGLALVKADCFRIRTEGSPLNGAYLMHFLNTAETLRLAFDASRGATRPRMTLGMLRDLRVPVPNLQNQNELVANLEARLANVDAIAKHTNSQASFLDSLSAALLSRAFGT